MKACFMKFLSLSVILSLILLSAASCVKDKDGDDGPLRSLAAGDTVPIFYIKLNDGSDFSSRGDMKRSMCLLFFFDLDCPDCRKALPELQQTADRLAEKGMADVRVVCISRGGDAAAIAAFWKENGLTMAYSAQPDDRVYLLFANRIVPRYYVTLPSDPPVVGAYTTIGWEPATAVREIAKLR